MNLSKDVRFASKMACLRTADCRLQVCTRSSSLISSFAKGVLSSPGFYVFRSSRSDAFVAKGVPLSFQFLKVRRPAFFSVPQGVLTPFFQSDQQCCEGRLFFQSDQQCCEGRRASSLISSVAKSVPPSLISSVAKGVPLTLISSVAKGVPLSFSFLKVFGPKHSIVFMCLDQNTR
ncbi:unnamed protein product [Rodentolepis nana]|uniref:Transmembrane protein n=1 Tax=Rodentolepis nana TaxID=102285 RepID=A0A0R3THE1_RODNA|nr:unnamed protein product [Rodentolepis nana]